MSKQICILSDHNELTELANNLEPYWREQVIICEGLGQNALILASKFEKEGIEAIITTGINVQKMNDNLRIPVVTIPITTYDLICTFEEIKKKSNKIALLQLQHYNSRIPKIAELLKMDITQFLFNHEDEASTSMLKAFDQGFRYFVGGALTCKIAKEYGYEAIPFQIRSDALIRALQNALEITKIRKRERKEVLELHAIFNFAFEGIITSNSQGKIIMINPIAAKLLNINPESTINKKLSDVLSNFKDISIFHKKMEPQVVTIGGNKLVLSCVFFSGKRR